ncbi:MAG TPA: folylpolyglutamate synthase/dihydrofolate synthase family protein [Gemmatimonadaceae bacterium]|nr:folylpolyglutamate synthase/dihydrofolate synthase family protein [Gemmatimonadaceae bacterium]
MRTYGDALDFLYARTTGIWKLGLERVEAFLHSLGDPHERLQTLHVAGTNGKGSVCASLESVLRAKGLRVAKYTSPHLVDFRERFIIDGRPVAPDRIVDFVERWTPEVERLGATFFEATTAMAFEFFAEARVDVAVIETGLGGRLDATNVITPLVAGVSTIGIDHVEYLGATREEIAIEKAGIYKRGIPAVVGDPDQAIRGLLARHAHDHGANPVRVVYDEPAPAEVRVTAGGTSFRLGARPFMIPLLGAHQAANATVAIAMLEALPVDMAPTTDELSRGFSLVRLPGRFQRWGKYLFDVAHNPDAAGVLASTLAAVAPPRPVVAVLSVLSDKDWRGIMDELAPAVDRFILTNAPTAPPSRSWNIPDPLGYALERGWNAEVLRDFDRALVRAAEWGETVLIAGSFHTVGDAMARLEVSPTAE